MQLTQLVTWIPVSDALPEDEKKVLIASACGGVYAGFIREGDWFFQLDNRVPPEPLRVAASHWMGPVHHPAKVPAALPGEDAGTELLLARAETAKIEDMHLKAMARKAVLITALECEIEALKAEVARL